MKKSYCIAMALAMLLSLSACGTKNTTPSTSKPKTPATKPTTEATILPTMTEPTLETNIPDPSVDSSMPDSTMDPTTSSVEPGSGVTGRGSMHRSNSGTGMNGSMGMNGNY